MAVAVADGDARLAEAVAGAVLARYAGLPKNGKPGPTEWTILAGLAASRPHGGGGAGASRALNAYGLEQQRRQAEQGRRRGLWRQSWLRIRRGQERTREQESTEQHSRFPRARAPPCAHGFACFRSAAAECADASGGHGPLPACGALLRPDPAPRDRAACAWRAGLRAHWPE